MFSCSPPGFPGREESHIRGSRGFTWSPLFHLREVQTGETLPWGSYLMGSMAFIFPSQNQTPLHTGTQNEEAFLLGILRCVSLPEWEWHLGNEAWIYRVCCMLNISRSSTVRRSWSRQCNSGWCEFFGVNALPGIPGFHIGPHLGF